MTIKQINLSQSGKESQKNHCVSSEPHQLQILQLNHKEESAETLKRKKNGDLNKLLGRKGSRRIRERPVFIYMRVCIHVCMYPS
jgi:hypothetical protein